MQRDTLLLGLRKGRVFPVQHHLCVFTGPYHASGIPSAASTFVISAPPRAPSLRTAGAGITKSSFQVPPSRLQARGCALAAAWQVSVHTVPVRHTLLQ